MVTVGSLFSGIGGIDLGLERAGMQCAWQVEIDPYCVKVLERHWPGVKRYGDIRQIKWEKVEKVDLICGGFPCQPFSVAGKRRGAADERNLWPEMLWAVRGIRPKWVLGENVPGIGDYLDTICADLEAEAYQVLPLEIPAAAFGAPHLRYRLFVIARRAEQSGLMADSNGAGPFDTIQAGRNGTRRGGEVVAHANSTGLETGRPALSPEGCKTSAMPWNSGERLSLDAWWAVEPDVCRVAHGVLSRVDRLRCLGNAVVPQVAEWLGRRILEVEDGR